MTASTPDPWQSHFFQGRRLKAEICLYAHAFRNPSLDLECELQVLHRSYGVPAPLEPPKDCSCSDAPLSQALASISHASSDLHQDSANFVQLTIDHACAPDPYLLYALHLFQKQGYSLPARSRFLALRLLTFLSHQFPSRLDLRIALISRLGFLDLLKGRFTTALSAQEFYSDPQPAITMLTGLWINGCYAQIFRSYCEQQMLHRFFPASDFIIRVYSILGLDRLAANYFRRIFYSQALHLPTVTLSNIVFCELGFETVDHQYLQDVIRLYRSPKHSPTPSAAGGRGSSKVAQSPQRLSIDERPTLVVLSADLRNHPVGRFWFPMARQLHQDFRLVNIAYHQHEEDSLRYSFKNHCTEWIGLDHGEDPSECLARIQPTLLLDLGGHTADNRPGVLNQRHASVQASYLGFYGPNFGNHCDWWILDQATAKLVENSYPIAEPIWQLDGPGFCFDCSLHGLPTTDTLTFTSKQTLTFGSFNHTRKITPHCIQRFAAVLKGNSESLLLLRSHSFFDPQVRRYFLRSMVEAGAAPEQVRSIPYATSSEEAMHDYGQVHIHLDSYPVCGTTTTLDALAMGTPVLTCPTQLYAGAISASILSQLGLGDWICANTDSMAAKAREIFATYQSANARLQLAQSVRDSPLFDTATTPISFSKSLRQMIKATIS